MSHLRLVPIVELTLDTLVTLDTLQHCSVHRSSALCLRASRLYNTQAHLHTFLQSHSKTTKHVSAWHAVAFIDFVVLVEEVFAPNEEPNSWYKLIASTGIPH